MNPQTTSRLLSTSARVHPSYLPYLHNRSRGRGIKWMIPPVLAVIGAGYAAVTYRRTQAEQQQAAAAQAEAERRRRDAALADAYGDRSSLEELERAMQVYEAQQQQQQQ